VNESAVNGLSAGGETRVAPGLQAGKNTLTDPTRSRFLVLFSDGVPEDEATSKQVASVIRQAGITIVTIGMGKINSDFLQSLVQDPLRDYYAAGGPQSLGVALKLLLPMLCGSGPSVRLPCTGSSMLVRDISTGMDISNGIDNRWSIDHDNEDPDTPAHLVSASSLPSQWSQQSGSRWISSSADGSAPESAEQSYKTQFSATGLPTYVDGIVEGFADDSSSEFYVNDHAIPIWATANRKGRVTFDSSHLVLFDQLTNRLAINVHNFAAQSGTSLQGRIRMCADAGGVGTTTWTPDAITCNHEVWESQHSSPDNPDHLPLGIPNPANPSEKAWCFQVHSACFIGSKIVDWQPGACWASEIMQANLCGNGRYRYPQDESWDLGSKFYMAMPRAPELGFNPSTSDLPGRMRLIASLPSYQFGEWPTQVYRNADWESASEDIVERYVSTCELNGQKLCALPAREDGHHKAMSYQWGIYSQETYLPLECTDLGNPYTATPTTGPTPTPTP